MTKKTKKEKLIEVDVDLDDQTFLKLAKIAHEEDITFNKLCNKLLKFYMKELKSERNKVSKRNS